ncbi:hypothetical protein [Streptomyces sp. SID10815]|uniref:hypothetical protein n=1 Tax=Streptomyces sp. SID10815 TaxID=2706027 RepID=UPI001943A889|nr:hypothetical protein [Streptomyces sp. SID10815]
MSSLVLLVALLLASVGIVGFGGLAYLVHRHPSTRDPLAVGLTGMALLAALVMPIVTR